MSIITYRTPPACNIWTMVSVNSACSEMMKLVSVRRSLANTVAYHIDCFIM